MNGGKAPPTSEQQMNVYRMRDKMSLLNAEFLQVFKGFYAENRHYDFSGTMQSYMEHAQKLKTMYNFNETPAAAPATAPAVAPAFAKPKKAAEPAKPAEITPAPAFQRKIAKATRRNAPNNSDSPRVMNSTVIDSSSPMSAPPAPKFGDISVIAKETPVPITKSFGKPTIPEEPAEASAPAARKRAIRGGGPLGGSESVVFKTAGGEEQKTTSSTTTIPMVTIKFPEPTKDFWNKKDDGKQPEGGSLFAFLINEKDEVKQPSKFTGFSFGKKPADSEEEKKTEKSPESTLKPPTSSLFGKGSTSSLFGKPADKSPESTLKAPTSSLFGKPSEKSPESSLKAPTSSVFGKPSEKSPESAPKPSTSSLFGGKPASPTKPLSFGGPSLFGGSSTSSGTSGTSGASAPLTFGGASAAPTLTFGSSSSGGLFAGLAQKAMENKDKEGEKEDEEYVPPKVETVENEEPDAVLSSKCSVFKFTGKEYTKLGVGMLHIKKTDDKHSLLIRAATTTGTVWLNALCNKAMKATKVDEKGERIRLTCPVSMSEMTTMMIRFGSAEGAKKFLDKVDEVSS